ncbi:hypothetical protein [Nannocystis pusilla]|uniref:hypothetical protein n=1 Tax=Nannocystis pusilla TaxID=889268 RepID=UPI003DA1EFAD
MRKKTVPQLPSPGSALVRSPPDALAHHEPGRPAAPAPGASDCEWRPCDAELPVVMDALESLAGSLELRDRSSAAGLHWHLDASDIGLWVDITAVATDSGTSVGLQIRPAGGSFADSPWWHGDSYFWGEIVFGAAMILALFLVTGDLWVLAFIGLMTSAFFVSVLLLLVVIPEHRRALAQRAWTDRWRRDFWPALEARLHQRALYR